MELDWLIEALRQDRSPGGWRYRSIAEDLRGLIASGRLPAGHRLPPERALAAALGVSRSTVVRAYGVLRESGWARSTTGSGTYGVRPDLTHRAKMTDLGPSIPPRGARTGAAVDGLINLSIAHPEPLAELAGALHQVADAIENEPGTADYLVQGLPELRAAIADDYTARGLPTNARQIVVTAGAQQALSLTCELLLRRCRTVLVESPTYLGALDLLRSRGAHVIAVPSGPDGPDLDVLSELTARNHGATLFLMPTCHTVTGSRTSGAHRSRIAEIAARTSLTVIEDDILAGLTFEADRTPPLAAHATSRPVITIGATSKLLWNGLRIGWIRAPLELVGRLTRIKTAVDLGTSHITQLVTLHLLAARSEIAVRRVAEARRCLERTTDMLAAGMPSWRWHTPQGGRSIWVKLPMADVTQFVSVAVQQGVTIHTGSTFCPAGRHTDHIRLIFVQPEPLLTTGLQRLATAWEQVETDPPIR